jgi:hypothetical protein
MSADIQKLAVSKGWPAGRAVHLSVQFDGKRGCGEQPWARTSRPDPAYFAEPAR